MLFVQFKIGLQYATVQPNTFPFPIIFKMVAYDSQANVTMTTIVATQYVSMANVGHYAEITMIVLWEKYVLRKCALYLVQIIVTV